MDIKLYGEVADKYKVPQVEIQVNNFRQLISFFNMWWGDFSKSLSQLDGLIIMIEQNGEIRSLDHTQLDIDLLDVDVVHIIPDINGNGEAIAVAAFGLAAGSTAALVVGAIINIAISFVISAIVQSLAPKPDMSNHDVGRPEDVPSTMFNGVLNITEEGYPVAQNFGLFRFGGTILSSGLYVEEIPV